MFRKYRGAVLAALVALAGPAAAEPLASWRQTEARDRITGFVAAVTDPSGPDFVPEAERIAVFDTDGTLWSEKPYYFQLLFSLERLRNLAESDPALLSSPAFGRALNGDLSALTAPGNENEGLPALLTLTHTGISVDTFTGVVRKWLEEGVHPGTGLRYDEMRFQPMMEMMAYLREAGFRTYVVTSGGLSFVRAFAQEVFGVPPEQVIGTTADYSYDFYGDTPVIMNEPGIFYLEDMSGKPLAIEARLGRRPILTVGNADGDLEMLDWSTSGPGRRLGVLIHHTDAAREYAYDRESNVGRLDRALDEAAEKDWLVVDMAEDWEVIWPGGAEPFLPAGGRRRD